MSLLPSNEEVRRQLENKKRGVVDWNLVKRGICPFCENKMRDADGWFYCRRPTQHELVRISKNRFHMKIDHSTPWDKAPHPNKRRMKGHKRPSKQHRKFSKFTHSDRQHFNQYQKHQQDAATLLRNL